MYDIPFISMMTLRSIGNCRHRRWDVETKLRRWDEVETTLRRRTTSKCRRSDQWRIADPKSFDESTTGSASDWHR